MPIIIVSNQDLASLTIKQQLLEIGNFIETSDKFEGNIIYEHKETKVLMVTINSRLIDANYLDEYFDTDLFIFASKHKSESEKPSLLVHAPGNWTEDNSYGGNVCELALTSARMIKQILKELNQQVNQQRQISQLEYDVTSEVTHHGPTNLKIPCVFIELGSNETYWKDPIGAQIVAKTILKVFSENFPESNLKYAIGFGGPHYASNFNKVQLNTNYAISHIAAKYVLDKITENLIIEAINKTIEKVSYALLDWKGMVKAQREKIIGILDKLDIEYHRIQKILAK
ncbi:MAG: D-aminoacyl-tRNA deacylase [Candidatus Helarchaeota archaeon]